MELRTEDVETIDLHPHLLNENWEDYARFVLYHEYLPRWGIGFTILNSAGWKTNGHRMVPTVGENSRNSYGRGLQHGCGYVRPATKNILGSAKRTAVFDVESARQFLLMCQTCRKQTKQVIISRKNEVNPCKQNTDALPSSFCFV